MYSQHAERIHGGYDVTETTNCILCLVCNSTVYAQIRVIFPLPIFHHKVTVTTVFVSRNV